MNELGNLIKNEDYYILLLYAAIGYFFLHYIIFKKASSGFKKVLPVFYLLKTCGCILISTLIIQYWKGGDSISYYTEGQNLVKFVRTDFTNIKYFLLPVDRYDLKIQLDNELIQTINGAGLESNFLVSRFCGLLYPFALGKFLILNFLFCYIAVVGQLILFRTVYNRYPALKKYLAVCILFIPALLLYASYINKETLCFSFMCMGLYFFFRLIKNQHTLLNLLLLLCTVFLIGLIKIYVIYALGAALFLFAAGKLFFRLYHGSVFSKVLLFSVLLGIGIFFYNYPDVLDPYVLDVADTANIFQERYNDDFGETSAFQIGEVDATLRGVLLKAPFGLYTTYFRPHLWEVKKPIILFSAIESLLTLLLVVYALVKKGRNIRKLMHTDNLASLIFYYIIFLGIIIGLTTFNFGTLVRYKIPGLPFLCLFFILLLHYEHGKSNFIPFYNRNKIPL